ncbi:Tfp pilus assembly protein FimT/FimU [Chitinibacter sp. GC72]|uniref:pilus assembly FimT family protein n=1 Tax=Chitinibacter sp. GC72 TaxID=1526917 RepID=UPI0012F9A30D|nr:prepilin-type N-terminal cleavage/methylation domain-containing protein [Chitinibacter sp. GC72]
MKTKHQGFTLIEMMITIAILGILLAIAVPNFTDWLNKKRIESAYQALNTLFQFAKSETAKQNQNIYVRATLTAKDNWTIKATNSANTTTFLEVKSSDFRKIEMDDTTTESTISTLNGSFFSAKELLPTFGNTSSQSILLKTADNKYQVKTTISTGGVISNCTPTGKPSLAGIPSCL